MSRLRPNEIAALRQDDRTNAASPAAGVIESDRTCVQCGYALRGLPIGGDCPECGTSTRIPADIDHPLSLMPLAAIQRLKWGCWSSFWCMAAALVLIAVHSGGPFPPILTLSVLAALTISWQVAVRFVTPALGLPQAALRGFSDRGRLRLAAQWAQLGWPVAAGAALAMEITSGTAATVDTLTTAMRIGMAVGVAGLMALALLLERLAEWAREPHGEKYFNFILWALPFAVLILIWEPRSFWFAILLNLAAMITMILFPFAMLILARSVGLSVHHAIEYELRRERQDERRERFFEQVVRPHVAGRGPGGAASAMPEEITLAEPTRKTKDDE